MGWVSMMKLLTSFVLVSMHGVRYPSRCGQCCSSLLWSSVRVQNRGLADRKDPHCLLSSRHPQSALLLVLAACACLLSRLESLPPEQREPDHRVVDDGMQVVMRDSSMDPLLTARCCWIQRHGLCWRWRTVCPTDDRSVTLGRYWRL